MDDFAVYNGKKVDLRLKMAELAKELDGVAEFQGVAAQPRFLHLPPISVGFPKLARWTTSLLKLHMTVWSLNECGSAIRSL